MRVNGATSAGVLAVVLGAVAASPGCTDSGPAPTIRNVRPVRAYSDVSVPLTFSSPELRAGWIVDVAGQTATYDESTLHAWLVPTTPGLPTRSIDPVRWHMPSREFVATIPALLDADVYALRVRAPDGRETTAPGAFEGLGPDVEAPTVTLGSPAMNQSLPEDAVVEASVYANDALGQLATVSLVAIEEVERELMSCNAEVDSYTGLNKPDKACKGVFHTPPLADEETSRPFWVRAVATDVAGNRATSDPVEVPLGHLPVITSFSPTAAGLTKEVQMSVYGLYFSPTARAFIGGNPLLGASRVNEGLIVGRIPQSTRPDMLKVEVLTEVGIGEAPTLFTYLAAPRLRLVTPAEGPPTGGIRVTIAGNDLRAGITIKFGTSLTSAVELQMPAWEANTKVTGCLPPGQGTVTVWAIDEQTGDDQLEGAFTYTDGPTDPNRTIPCAASPSSSGSPSSPAVTPSDPDASTAAPP